MFLLWPLLRVLDVALAPPDDPERAEHMNLEALVYHAMCQPWFLLPLVSSFATVDDQAIRDPGGSFLAA